MTSDSNTEANRNLMKRHVATMNSGRIEDFDDYCSDDYKWIGVEPDRMGSVTGRDEFKNVIGDLIAALPDIHVEIVEMVAEGNDVAVHITLEGHHTGKEMMGVAPSGAYVKWHGYSIYTVRDGKICEESFFDDTYAIEKALGI